MPYSRLHDTFAFDPILLELGNDAFAVVARSISYSGAQLTDGFVPKAMAEMIDPGLKTYASLCQRGVLLSKPGGFQYPEWDRLQRTKKQVEDDRERQRGKALEAMKDRHRGEDGKFRVKVHPSGGVAPPASSSPLRSSPIQSEQEPEFASAPPPQPPEGKKPEASKEGKPEKPKPILPFPTAFELLSYLSDATDGFVSKPANSREVDQKFYKLFFVLMSRFPQRSDWEKLAGWLKGDGVTPLYGVDLCYSSVAKHAGEWIPQARAWHHEGKPNLAVLRSEARVESNGYHLRNGVPKR